jgi:DNA-binding NarL/FixJ family response regulator
MSNHQSLFISEKRKTPIRIVLADDNEVVRNSLKLFIEMSEDLQLVGEASNGHEAFEVCTLQKPDLILMDIMMPKMNGIEATQIISQQCPDVVVLALASLSADGNIQKIIEAGAVSVISKQISIDDITRIIRESVNNNALKSPSRAEISEDTQNQDRAVKR